MGRWVARGGWIWPLERGEMGGGPGGPLYLCSRPTPCGGAPPRNTNWVCQDLLRHVIGGEGGGAREGGGAASKIVYRLYSSDPHESVGAQTHTASSHVIHRHRDGAHGCRRKVNKREFCGGNQVPFVWAAVLNTHQHRVLSSPSICNFSTPVCIFSAVSCLPSRPVEKGGGRQLAYYPMKQLGTKVVKTQENCMNERSS